MKRFVKILLLILAAAAIGAGVYLNMNKTLNVSAIVMTPETARLTFTEQGVVDYEDQVSIYPPLGGKILEIYVTEGQVISAGDPICTIDDSGTALAVSKAEAQISSLEAQIDSQEAQIGSLKAQIGSLEAQKRNLDSETAKQKDALVTQKNNLAKELDALNAQQSSVRVSKEERLRLQNIILDQNLADIERLTADYNNIKTLYDGGVIPEKDLEASEKALDAAKAQYDQNQQQLQIIANGDAQSNEDYFAASRGALQEQLNGIDTSLSKDYSGAMKDYYNAQIQGVNAQIQGVNAQIQSVSAQIQGVHVDIQTQDKLREDAIVVSTTDGIVIDLPASKSNMASGASPAAVLAVGRSLVTVYVSTNDIKTVTPGKEVELILKRREGDETYRGTVVKIDDKAEIKISSLGVEERKVKVYVEPQTNPDLFLSGYDVDVRFLVYEKENALTLPKTAVFKDGDASRVWEIAGGVLQKTDVTKGMELSNDVIIESGLSAGSVVVSDAALTELKAGAKAAVE